jgi:hypothetical protein
VIRFPLACGWRCVVRTLGIIGVRDGRGGWSSGTNRYGLARCFRGGAKALLSGRGKLVADGQAPSQDQEAR